MRDKLRILMQNENLSASRLADILEIKPAGISHILSGRNNPSYELVCKIVNRFPKINPYWLLGDSDKMYNDTAGSANLTPNGNGSPSAQSMSTNSLFASLTPTTGNAQQSASPEVILPSTQATTISPTAQPSIGDSAGSSDIERIIIAYKNGTFASYLPKK